MWFKIFETKIGCEVEQERHSNLSHSTRKMIQKNFDLEKVVGGEGLKLGQFDFLGLP